MSTELEQLRGQLLQHPIYDRANDLRSVRILMREHVFAVWDFMSLLKRLQRDLTSVDLPWMPAADPEACRFVLEVVLGEEADEDGRGSYTSHFELYRLAMQELGADTEPIDQFLAHLQAGQAWSTALESSAALPSTKDFVRFSLTTALDRPTHEVAAAFFYGREDIIPEMFQRLIDSLPDEGVPIARLQHYLNRHIELDGDHHGPLAERLMDRLCGGDPERRAGAERCACEALRQRLRLWDGILAAIEQ